MTLGFFGASLLALAIATPAVAQTGAAPADNVGEQGIIDELAPAGSPDVGAPPAPTGDVVLDRLNALEYKVRALESRNADLEEQLNTASGRVETVTERAGKGLANNGVVPTFSDTSGNVTFKVRGVIDADYVAFNERRGGYDYNGGTAFRRARLGFEGTAFKNFKWRIEADFAGNAVNLQDAYVQYIGIKQTEITLGQYKAPFGLESNNSDNYNVFLERGTFNVAAANLGAERRIGASAAYVKPNFTATIGVFGDNEGVSRASGTTTSTPGESWGINGRVTWEPILQPGKILHVGVGSYWRTNLRSSDTGEAVRLSERPSIRVDNGNILDTGVIPGVDNAYYVGAEAAAVYGPVTLAGEYGKVHLDRAAGLSNPDFDGFHVYGTVFLTGETRSFKNGNYDRVKPAKNFDGKGGWGAWEVALRYDQADFGETPVASRIGNKAHSWTAGVNWHWNPNMKLLFNYIRFTGANTPLDPVGAKTKGDAFATRLHIDW